MGEPALRPAGYGTPTRYRSLLRVFRDGAGRYPRRASVASMPSPVGVYATLTLVPGCSPWRLQSAHDGTPADITDGDGRAEYSARDPPICAVAYPQGVSREVVNI